MEIWLVYCHDTIYKMNMETFVEIWGQTMEVIETIYCKFPFILLGTKLCMVNFSLLHTLIEYTYNEVNWFS